MGESLLLDAGIAILSKMLSSGIQQGMNRSDFSYTHQMTNIPAQVKEMREAGLNPALAYGQISAPQGQSLGQYQQDFLEGLRDIKNARKDSEEAAYVRAETNLLNAKAQYLISKARAEAGMAEFDWRHQYDRYNLEIEGKGLVNAGQKILNRGYQLDNKSKIISNDILSIEKDIQEFNKQMKSIDASKHADYVDAEIRRLVTASYFEVTQAWALKQKVPKEMEALENSIRETKERIYQMRKNGVVTREQIRKTTEFQKLENEYKKWLGRDPRVRSMIENSNGWVNDLVNVFITPAY